MKNKTMILAASLLAMSASMPVLAEDDSDSSRVSHAPSALVDGRWYVSPMLSYTLPDRARGADSGVGFRIAGGRKLTDGLAVEAFGNYDSMEAKLYSVGVSALVFPFVAFPNVYGVASLAYAKVDSHPGPVSSYNSANIETGVGFLYPLTQRVLLRADGRFRLDASGRHGVGTSGQRNEVMVDDVFNVGVMLPLGPDPETAKEAPLVVATAADDSDADGVLDPNDRCPGTPAGAVVDSNGCETDTDKDGVIDRLDKCPDTPLGTAVDANGCPLDSDQDGVVDASDDCPNTPPGTQVLANGCTLKADCRKPREGEQADSNGCAVEQKFELRGVKFDFDSDRLTDDAQVVMEGVAKVLGSYPDISVEIQGHTCNIGSAEYNLGLSDRRAKSVKKFLTEHGIEGSRMTTKGYGLTEPIDSNETEPGRENNRRVELKVLDAAQ